MPRWKSLFNTVSETQRLRSKRFFLGTDPQDQYNFLPFKGAKLEDIKWRIIKEFERDPNEELSLVITELYMGETLGVSYALSKHIALKYGIFRARPSRYNIRTNLISVKDRCEHPGAITAYCGLTKQNLPDQQQSDEDFEDATDSVDLLMRKNWGEIKKVKMEKGIISLPDATLLCRWLLEIEGDVPLWAYSSVRGIIQTYSRRMQKNFICMPSFMWRQIPVLKIKFPHFNPLSTDKTERLNEIALECTEKEDERTEDVVIEDDPIEEVEKYKGIVTGIINDFVKPELSRFISSGIVTVTSITLSIIALIESVIRKTWTVISLTAHITSISAHILNIINAIGLAKSQFLDEMGIKQMFSLTLKVAKSIFLKKGDQQQDAWSISSNLTKISLLALGAVYAVFTPSKANLIRTMVGGLSITSMAFGSVKELLWSLFKVDVDTSKEYELIVHDIIEKGNIIRDKPTCRWMRKDVEEAEAWIKSTDTLMTNIPRGKSNPILVALRANVGEAVANYNIAIRTQKTRPAPVNILLYGHGGAGKSYMATRIVNELSALYGEDLRTYPVSTNSKHYPTYNSEEVLLVDEFAKEAKVGTGIIYQDANELTAGIPFNMQGAALQEKYQFANFKACIFMSNEPPEKIDINYREEAMEAFWSRFIVISVEDPKYDNSKSRENQSHRKSDFSHLKMDIRKTQVVNNRDGTKRITNTVKQSVDFRNLVIGIADKIQSNQKLFKKQRDTPTLLQHDPTYVLEKFDQQQSEENERHVVYAVGRPATGKTTRVVADLVSVALRWDYKIVRYPDRPTTTNTLYIWDDFVPELQAQEFLQIYNESPRDTKFLMTSNYGPPVNKYYPRTWYRSKYEHLDMSLFDTCVGVKRRLGFEGPSKIADVVVVTRSSVKELWTGNKWNSVSALKAWHTLREENCKVKVITGMPPESEEVKYSIDHIFPDAPSVGQVLKNLATQFASIKKGRLIKMFRERLALTGDWRSAVIQTIEDEARNNRYHYIRLGSCGTVVHVHGVHVYVHTPFQAIMIKEFDEETMTIDWAGAKDTTVLTQDLMDDYYRTDHVLNSHNPELYDFMKREELIKTETWQNIEIKFPRKTESLLTRILGYIARLAKSIATFVKDHVKFVSAAALMISAATALYTIWKPAKEEYTIDDLKSFKYDYQEGIRLKFMKINGKHYYPNDDEDYGSGHSRKGKIHSAIVTAAAEGRLRKGERSKIDFTQGGVHHSGYAEVDERTGNVSYYDSDTQEMADHALPRNGNDQQIITNTASVYGGDENDKYPVAACWFIQSDVFVTPLHVSSKGKYVKYNGVYYKFRIIYADAAREVSFCKVEKPVPGIRNTTNHILPEKTLHDINKCKLLRVTSNGNISTMNTSYAFSKTVSPALNYIDIECNFTGTNGTTAAAVTQDRGFYGPGDCGFPTVCEINGTWYVIGLHVATRGIDKSAVSCVLSQDLLTTAIDSQESMKTEGYSMMPREFSPSSKTITYIPDTFMEKQIPITNTFLPNGPNFKTVASFDNNFGMDASCRKKPLNHPELSNIFGILKKPVMSKRNIELQHSDKIPDTAGKPHAAYIRMSKAENNIGTGASRLKIFANDARRLGSYFRTRLNHKIRPLTKQESLEGIDSQSIDGMKLNTSAGDPINMIYETSAKSDFYTRAQDGTVMQTDKGVALDSLVNKHWTGAKNGLLFTLPFSGKLKAELLPVEKVWKKRIYSVVPIHAVINHRRLFMPVQKALEREGVKSPFCIAMYPQADWDTFMKHNLEMGSKMMDIDFSSYDMTVPRAVLKSIAEFMRELYDVPPDHHIAKQLNTYMEELSTNPILIEKDLVTRNGGMPSGCSATSLIDGIALYIMVYNAYCNLRRKDVLPDEFENRVRVKTCGDDCLITVSDLDNDFDFFYLKEYFKELGMTITSSRKDGTETAFTPLSEVTFVSRYTLPHPQHPGVYISRLKEASIAGLFSYSKASTANETIAMLENALVEMFAYGKEKYEQAVRAIISYAKKHDVKYEPISYDSMSQITWQLAVDGTLPDFGLNLNNLLIENQEELVSITKREFKFKQEPKLQIKSITRQLNSKKNIKENMEHFNEVESVNEQWKYIHDNQGKKIAVPQPTSAHFYLSVAQFKAGKRSDIDNVMAVTDDRETTEIAAYKLNVKIYMDNENSAPAPQPGKPQGIPEAGPPVNATPNGVITDQSDMFVEGAAAPAPADPTPMRPVEGSMKIYESTAGHDGTALPWAGHFPSNLARAYEFARTTRLNITTATDYGTVLYSKEFDPWDQTLISDFMRRESLNHSGFIGFIELCLTITSHFYNYGNIRIACVPAEGVKAVKKLTGESLIRKLELYKRTDVSINADGKGIIDFRPSMINMKTVILRDYIRENKNKSDDDPTKESYGLLVIYTNTRLQNAQGDAKTIEAFIETRLGNDGMTRYGYPDDGNYLAAFPPKLPLGSSLLVTDGNLEQRRLAFDKNVKPNRWNFERSIQGTLDPGTIPAEYPTTTKTKHFGRFGYQPEKDNFKGNIENQYNFDRAQGMEIKSTSNGNKQEVEGNSNTKLTSWDLSYIGVSTTQALDRPLYRTGSGEDKRKEQTIEANTAIDLFVKPSATCGNSSKGVIPVYDAMISFDAKWKLVQDTNSARVIQAPVIPVRGNWVCTKGFVHTSSTGPTGYASVKFIGQAENIPGIKSSVTAGVSMLESSTGIELQRNYESYFEDNPDVGSVIWNIRDINDTIIATILINRTGIWTRSAVKYGILPRFLSETRAEYVLNPKPFPVLSGEGIWVTRNVDTFEDSMHYDGDFVITTAIEKIKRIVDKQESFDKYRHILGCMDESHRALAHSNLTTFQKYVAFGKCMQNDIPTNQVMTLRPLDFKDWMNANYGMLPKFAKNRCAKKFLTSMQDTLLYTAPEIRLARIKTWEMASIYQHDLSLSQLNHVHRLFIEHTDTTEFFKQFDQEQGLAASIATGAAGGAASAANTAIENDLSRKNAKDIARMQNKNNLDVMRLSGENILKVTAKQGENQLNLAQSNQNFHREMTGIHSANQMQGAVPRTRDAATQPSRNSSVQAGPSRPPRSNHSSTPSTSGMTETEA